MKKLLKISLGILTSIGGFLDAGAIATNAAAGATFGTRLLWVTALGTLFIIFLTEMSGRLAVVSKHTIADAIREHFGFRYHVIPLVAEVIVDFFILSAEIGGLCIALQFVTGIAFRWWALPVGFFIWFVIWIGSFGHIEKITAFLGLITICFLVAAFRLHPPLHQIASGLMPHGPAHDGLRYWYLAVSVMGGIVTPYVLYFYSAGAIEDKWDMNDLGINRGVATLGMTFGCVIAMAIMIVTAGSLQHAGISIDRYEQAPLMLVPIFGRAGVLLFAASLAICCFGAAIEAALAVSYVVAQSFGWEWGEDLPPNKNARFASTYTLLILLASLLVFTGLDPLRLTMMSMGFAVVILPLVVMPLLVIMNDEKYLKANRNGWISNTVGFAALIAAIVMSVVAIPLEILGG
jgi:Mn2+/Fe2+ NRAMP family transporter